MIELVGLMALAFAGTLPLLLLAPLAMRNGAKDHERRLALTDALRAGPHGRTAARGAWWSHHGVEICVDLHPHPTTNETVTRVRARHPELPPALRIGPSSLGAAQHGRLQQWRTGDPRLDLHVRLSGEPQAVLMARLAPSTRATLARAVALGGSYREGVWTILATEVRTDADTIDAMVRLAVRASWALIGSDPSPEALRARVGDPLPGVGERAFALAVSAGAPDEWLSWISTSHDPRRVLPAASARGERGRARLWWLVDRGEAPYAFQAAMALATLPPDPRLADLERVLVGSLERGPRVEVIEALGRVASVQVVPDLRALGGLLPIGPVAAAARRAIALIQARASGEVGGLAVATPEGGELALADERSWRGRLSATRGG